MSILGIVFVNCWNFSPIAWSELCRWCRRQCEEGTGPSWSHLVFKHLPGGIPGGANRYFEATIGLQIWSISDRCLMFVYILLLSWSNSPPETWYWGYWVLQALYKYTTYTYIYIYVYLLYVHINIYTQHIYWTWYMYTVRVLCLSCSTM